MPRSRRSKNVEGLDFALSVLRKERWTPTPLLPASTIGRRAGVELWLKREDCSPVGSFKLRGALVTFAARLEMAKMGGDHEDIATTGVYVASSGNYGAAIALAGERHDVRVTVVVPEGAPQSKLRRLHDSGARVEQHGRDFDAAKDFARDAAAEEGAAFWEDGVVEEMSWGAATIGWELLEDEEPWDAVIVPIGNGSLMRGIATVMRARSPGTMVIGAVPSRAPAMSLAMRGERWDEAVGVDTIADGLAVRVPIPEIVEDLKSLVDDVWVVDEPAILSGIKSLMELEQVMVEPSAAITIAGLTSNRRALSGKRVAAVITGAHLGLDLIPKALASDSLL